MRRLPESELQAHTTRYRDRKEKTTKTTLSGGKSTQVTKKPVNGTKSKQNSTSRPTIPLPIQREAPLPQNQKMEERKHSRPQQQTQETRVRLQKPAKRPRYGPTNKFHELLERSGLVQGKTAPYDEDERDMRMLEKKLGITSNKVPRDFLDSGLSCIPRQITWLYSIQITVFFFYPLLLALWTGLSTGSDTEDQPTKEFGLDDSSSSDGAPETPSSDHTSDEEDFGIEDWGNEEQWGSEEEWAKKEDERGVESDVSPENSELITKEDIYGRVVNARTGEVLKIQSGDKSAHNSHLQVGNEKLGRQVKGLMNKLSQANIALIVAELEALFSANSKNDMTEILTINVLSSCCGDASALSSLVVVNVAVIAILHTLIGMEVGGKFLDSLAKRFQESYQSGRDKDTINCVMLFIHMYNFKLIHCSLVYDMIRQFLSNFRALDIELLLVVLQSIHVKSREVKLLYAGPVLRSEDPASLKDIVLEVQSKVASSVIVHDSRVEYMVSTITDLKNNKLKPTSNTHSVVVSLQATVKKIVGKRVNGGGELRISWKDLMSQESKGRWWLVGSAWSGSGVGQSLQIADDLKKQSAAQSVNFGSDLMALAQKHKMNTDIRKAIFCALMSSTDYVDAFEQLVKLKLKKMQDREVIFVLLHCCAQEKTFNNYYAQLALRLCTYHSDYKFSMQVAFYDKFKAIAAHQVPQRSCMNLAAFLAALVLEGAVPLTVLKQVNFLELNQDGQNFFETFFSEIFSKANEDKMFAAFKRLALVDKKDRTAVTAKRGILYFLTHYCIYPFFCFVLFFVLIMIIY